MGSDKLNRTLDHHKYSLPLSAGEINKYEFIEALNRLINKFGLHNLFYLTNNGKTRML